MTILAIDTSVGISVAVHDGLAVLAQINRLEHAIQGEMTAQYILDMVRESGTAISDITDVVVGVGPGPYTGLRVGITTGLVFAHARGIRVHGLCSLDAIAFDVLAHGEVSECVVVTDARRKELYWAHYGVTSTAEPQVNTPAELQALFSGGTFVGPGVSLYPDVIAGENVSLRAAALAEVFVSGTGHIRDVVPMYLRKPDAVEPAPRKLVTPA